MTNAALGYRQEVAATGSTSTKEQTFPPGSRTVGTKPLLGTTSKPVPGNMRNMRRRLIPGLGGRRMNRDEEFFRNMASEFEAGFNTRNVDRIMRFYGAKYVDVNLRNPVQTKAERREYYRRVIERPSFQGLKVRTDDTLVRGDHAFVRGTILLTETVADTKETIQRELRYLEIAERQPDGSWLVVWGMDGPVQEYSPIA
jgi:ketosteroid isomerase-like protein